MILPGGLNLPSIRGLSSRADASGPVPVLHSPMKTWVSSGIRSDRLVLGQPTSLSLAHIASRASGVSLTTPCLEVAHPALRQVTSKCTSVDPQSTSAELSMLVLNF